MKKSSRNPKLGTVGGQAVLEGVMMRSKTQYTTAVRLYDSQKIVRETHKSTSLRDRYKILNIPIVRGFVNFLEMMKLSFSTITFSAEAQGVEEETKFEKWLTKVFGKSLMKIAAGIGVVLGVVLSVGLFIWLPKFLADLMLSGADAKVAHAAIQGGLRIFIFVSYIFLAGLMPDMRRTFAYHGAEHKSIFCYEKGLELTVENVAAQKRFHPRCGTSFFFVMMILGIFISVFLNFIPLDKAVLGNVAVNVIYTLMKIVTIPIVVGVGFEIILYAGKHDNFIVRVLTAPGLWMQRLTTKEPDGSQMEVAIVALKSALPGEFPEDSVFAGIEQPPEDDPPPAAEETDAPTA